MTHESSSQSTVIDPQQLDGMSVQEIINLHALIIKEHHTNTSATRSVVLHFSQNPRKCWTKDAWEWLLHAPLDQIVHHCCLWEITDHLFRCKKISQQEMAVAIDRVWGRCHSVDFFKMIVRLTNQSSLGIVQHIAHNYQEQYTVLFKKIENDFSLRFGLECMLHAIDENTDALIAKTKISTPKLNHWREQFEQEQYAKQQAARLHTQLSTEPKSTTPNKKL